MEEFNGEKIRRLLIEQMELLAKRSSDPTESAEDITRLTLAMNAIARTFRTF